MRVLLALALLAYPLAVYLLIDKVSPWALAGALAVVTATRLLLAKHLSKQAITLSLIAVVAIAIIVTLRQDANTIKLYPVVLNIGSALWCAYTLVTPPSAIERLLNILNNSRAGLPVRMRERIPFDSAGLAPSDIQIRYLQGLTAVWLGYFIVNALAATVTALFASTAIWALYNGLIGYLLAGVVLITEFIYRPFYQRKYEGQFNDLSSEALPPALTVNEEMEQ